MEETPTIKQKAKRQPTECKICGAAALYSYFGAIVCGPCKIFFRRNARQNRFTCSAEGSCEIDVNTRHVCPACRLAKCFASGMQAELIRAPMTGRKNPQPAAPATQLAVVNIVRSDPTILSLTQWNLLSNLTHCYDEHSGLSIARAYLREQSQLPLKMRFRTATLQNFFASITTRSHLLYERNTDFLSLCSHDRSLLISKMTKHILGISGAFILRDTHLFDSPTFAKSIETVFGYDAYLATDRLMKCLDLDMTCMKLLLAILAFSTLDCVIYRNRPAESFSNLQAILSVQDRYTELTWRYLIHRFSYEEAVRCFAKILRCLFTCHEGIASAIDCQNYTDMVDAIVEQTEQSLTLSA